MELSVCSTQDGAVTLYFVIPADLVAEKCSKNLKCAFQACRENELGPIWLTTEDCLKMEPTKQDVFIVDPFEGEAYQYLLSGAFKCVVLGPRCLLSCLHEKRPVPELPSPLHNMAMHELVMTSTGFEKEEKVELQLLVEKMCGIYSNSFHEGITHLLAKLVGSKKYTVAIEKGTPIMTGEWVKAVWSSANQDSSDEISAVHEDFFKYACPVFKGLVICISQLPRAEKDVLKSLIVKNGGIYSANLEMSITSVLISPSSDGDKYKHAVQWRIPCLTQEWIYDSIERGYSLPLDDYKLLKKKCSTPTHDNTKVLGPPDVSLCSTIMNESLVNRFVDETAFTDHDQSVQFKRPQPPTVDPNIIDGVTSLRSLELQTDMKTELFLDGCKIFVSGFDKSLNEKLRKIMNAGGATRFSSLTESVSHVVIGKYVAEDMIAVDKLNTKPLVVTAKWLTACVKEGRLVEEGNYLFSMQNPNDTKAMPPPPPNITNIDETNSETFVDEDLVNQYLGGRDALDFSTLPDSQESTTEGSGIFKGKIFTLSGYSDEYREQIMEIIFENGGSIVDEASSERPHYSIVSMAGEGTVSSRAINCITHLFLEDCLEQEVLLPVEYFHLPFVWDVNCNILDGCVIATSTYKGKERLFVSHMSSKMGAQYQDMFSKKTNPNRGVKCSTHLICPSSEGDKYAAARKWGVPAVTKDWLLTCAQEGKRVSESSFLVNDYSTSTLDGVDILLQLLRICGVTKEAQRTDRDTPVNKNIKNLQYESLVASIITPDAETIRRMYPTPGCAAANDSLSAMPTPTSPYGQTWYPNPSPRTRKAFKRAIDALPDAPVPLKKQYPPLDTPDEVYMQIHTENLREFIKNHPPPKFTVKDEEAKENEPSVPVDLHGPLSGVVVFSSKKLVERQQSLYKAVKELGGNYRWTYDSSVTHFIHVGRLNDTNKEFRIARDNSNVIVAPDWVWMCVDENRRIEESLFPHTHNPKLSLSIITTKSTKRKCAKSQRNQLEESIGEEKLVPSEEENGDDCVSKQLEEIENLAKARRASTSRNKSLCDKNRSTPIVEPASAKSAPLTESESQSTGITWDDPQEREARANLEGHLVGDTQDILARRKSVNEQEEAKFPEDVEDDEPLSKEYSFVLSGLTNEDREYYCDVIRSLGGSMCDNQQSFDSSVTHIVSPKPSRSEKHLAAIASGKWILYLSFVVESLENGAFVDEEPHEWGNPRATSLPTLQPDSTEAQLAQACHRWRLNFLRTGRGAFHRMKVIFYTSRERISSFTRLFQAGEGTVLSHNDRDNCELTHCFVELNKCATVDLAAFAARNIPCLLPIYLNQYLVEEFPPDEMENCIPEYKQIIADMTYVS